MTIQSLESRTTGARVDPHIGAFQFPSSGRTKIPYTRRRFLKDTLAATGSLAVLVACGDSEDPRAKLREYVYSGMFPPEFTADQVLTTIRDVTWEDFNTYFPTGKPKPSISYVGTDEFRDYTLKYLDDFGIPQPDSAPDVSALFMFVSSDGAHIYVNSSSQIIADFQKKEKNELGDVLSGNGSLQNIVFSSDYHLFLAEQLFWQYSDAASTYTKSQSRYVSVSNIPVVVDADHGLGMYGEMPRMRVHLNGFHLGVQNLIANEMDLNMGLREDVKDNTYSLLVKKVQERLGLGTNEIFSYLKENDPWGFIEFLMTRVETISPGLEGQNLLNTAYTIWLIPSLVKYDLISFNQASDSIETLIPSIVPDSGSFDKELPTPNPPLEDEQAKWESLKPNPFASSPKITDPLSGHSIDLRSYNQSVHSPGRTWKSLRYFMGSIFDVRRG